MVFCCTLLQCRLLLMLKHLIGDAATNPQRKKCPFENENGGLAKASPRSGTSTTPTRTGTRQAKQFDLKKEADDYHARVHVDIRKGLHISPSKSPTVSEAAR